MKIEITNGYVEMSDILTREADRVYSDELSKGAEKSGELDKKGNPKFSLNLNQVEKASEALTMALVERVVVLKDGQEEEIPVTQKWVDKLDNNDYKKLEAHAYKVKKESIERSKKS